MRQRSSTVLALLLRQSPGEGHAVYQIRQTPKPQILTGISELQQNIVIYALSLALLHNNTKNAINKK
jgi:hypothetical protein